ncbi:MAG: hypothetical protein IKG27_03030 [Bacilli bacterium]|nr:hypothetical protein [Bacilli bacterium]
MDNKGLYGKTTAELMSMNNLKKHTTDELQEINKVREQNRQYAEQGLVGNIEKAKGVIPTRARIDREGSASIKKMFGVAGATIALVTGIGLGIHSISSRINSADQGAGAPAPIEQVDDRPSTERPDFDEIYAPENLLYDEPVMNQDGITCRLVVTKDGTCLFLTSAGPTTIMDGISAREYLSIRGVDVEELVNAYEMGQGKHK